MGGMGSGRTPRRVTDESTGSFVLGVKGLLGRLPRGAVGRGTVTFRSGRWGELAVEVRVDTTDPAAPYLELSHETRDEPTERIEYRVRLVTTRPRYGGERRWFVVTVAAGSRQVRVDGESARRRPTGSTPGAGSTS